MNKWICTVMAGACGVVFSGAAESQTTALPRAHAHNDYEHARPLIDALDQGFCSVEADVDFINTDRLAELRRFLVGR